MPQQIQLVDVNGNPLSTNANGANTIANSQAVNIASDQVVPVQSPTKEIIGTFPLPGALNNDLIPWTDVSAYSFISLHIVGTYSGTLTWQVSNDGVTTQSCSMALIGSGGFTPANYASSTTSTGQLWVLPRVSRYWRCRMTAFTSNTSLVGTLELWTIPPALFYTSINAIQNGTWTVQPGNTPNTTPWLFTQANNNASVPAGAANAVVKNAAGQLATLVVTTAGTGAGNVQLFDNASTNSGTVLFAFPATVSVAQAYQIYGWAKNGITAQNVANGPVFTVYYA